MNPSISITASTLKQALGTFTTLWLFVSPCPDHNSTHNPDLMLDECLPSHHSIIFHESRYHLLTSSPPPVLPSRPLLYLYITSILPPGQPSPQPESKNSPLKDQRPTATNRPRSTAIYTTSSTIFGSTPLHSNPLRRAEPSRGAESRAVDVITDCSKCANMNKARVDDQSLTRRHSRRHPTHSKFIFYRDEITSIGRSRRGTRRGETEAPPALV